MTRTPFRTRRQPVVTRLAVWLVTGTAALSSGACHDATAPERPAVARDLVIGAPVAPTPLATPGASSGAAVDINNLGVAVGTIYTIGVPTQVLWLPSGAMDTVPLRSVVGIGDNGSVAGDTPSFAAAVWSSSSDIVTTGPAGAHATGMSPGGSLVVGSLDVSPTPSCFNVTLGFLWTPGVAGPLWVDCAPDWQRVVPHGVNGTGTVVGTISRQAPPARNGFAWSPGGPMRALGSSATPSDAFAVNAAGTIVGTDDGRAVIHNGGSSVTVLAPELGASSAVAINDKGEIVINTANNAYLLRGSMLIPLASLGGCCAHADGVNEQSQVVGYATTPAGVQRPVRWDVAPPPPILVEINGPWTGDEGVPIEFVGVVFGVTPPFTRAWAFGDGITGEGGLASHAYADEGTFTVTFTVSSGDGRTATATSTATIANVAPTVSVAPGATIHSGESLTLRGRFEDPGALDAPWTWQLLAADGGVLVSGGEASAPDSIIAVTVLRRAGEHAFTLRVSDADGGVGSASALATVLRLPVPMTVKPSKEQAAAREHGLLTVTLHSTAGLDVADIDLATVRLGGVAPATRGGRRSMVALEDVDGDGMTELVLKFERAAVPPTGTLVLHADLTDARQVEGRWTR